MSTPTPDPASALPAATAGVAPGAAASVAAEAAAIDATAAQYAERAHALNTRRAYRADWAHFEAWCRKYEAQPLPADPRLVARYLAAHAAPGPDQLKVVTLQRRLSAIQYVHRAAGLDFDSRQRDLREVWRGIRRTHGVASHGKAPTVTEEIRALVAALDLATPIGVRDRALLLLGFAGCFRRSELVALDVRHLARHRDGIIVALEWSKTDQEGAGAEKGIPYGANPATCPVRAVNDWLAAAAITDGPIFRPVTRHGHVLPQRLSDRSVARVVQRTVQAARERAYLGGQYALAEHLDPTRYAGHSLRAGFITSAAEAGVSTIDIMRQSLHKREETLRKYVRHATVFRQNAASKVGL